LTATVLGNGGSACFYTDCDNGWVPETVAVNMPFFYNYSVGVGFAAL